MGKVFEIKGAENKRVLRLFAGSIPGQVRFHAEPLDGSEPSGTVEFAQRNLFKWHTKTYPLQVSNVFEKSMFDVDFRLTVRPDSDTRIVFESHHFRPEYHFKILVAVLALGVLSPLLIMLLANSST